MLLALALAVAPAHADPVDLDGDGSLDAIVIGPEQVTIAGHAVDYGGPELCTAVVHDVVGSDGLQEVALCQPQVRDGFTCQLYRLREGKLVKLAWPATPMDTLGQPTAVATSGNGVVLGDHYGRFFHRREKYLASGDRLVHVPQPLYAAGFDVKVDRSFPISVGVCTGATVANIRPGSTIRVVAEHGSTAGCFLVHISSGLMGWVSLETMISGSDDMMATWGAG